ncbi:uncharacterized protein N7518_003778 [Penicillium psychrosexuale]|uniref:uncharacterized protein n=1 Tax=Penicillium psychrosexuale TaxID=1002107 RepID=UPI0025452BE4|nr:uncharacterized protein N7518_003778 [Penicillium psychrosexuale]KAJ5801710.1 hypothetical protein N7518_003778 [Penicillium psychrosexuale]
MDYTIAWRQKGNDPRCLVLDSTGAWCRSDPSSAFCDDGTDHLPVGPSTENYVQATSSCAMEAEGIKRLATSFDSPMNVRIVTM